MEKVNENIITISEEKLHSINDLTYGELMSLNIKHGFSLDMAKLFEENHKYGKLLISIIVDSTKESEK